MLRERWRPQALAWLHRLEARAVARELGAPLATFHDGLAGGPFLLRLSDPQMLRAADSLTRAGIAYFGPRPAVMQTCYDKLQATRLAQAEGIDCPRTMPGNASGALPSPLIVKPRRGSDSLGVRVFADSVPPAYRNSEYLLQERVRGAELTVAVLRERVGAPLRILLPPGEIYSFARKYLRPPRREPVVDAALAGRVRSAALRIARLFAVNWAARVDFIYAESLDRLFFLECDAAPMIGAASAFAESLRAAGIAREEQLRLLTS